MGQENEDAMGSVTLGLLSELLDYRIRSAQLFTFERFRHLATHLGITSGQAGALVLIANNPGISQANLARAMRIERATMGTTISRMIDHGWVDRLQNSGNRRAYALFLSTKGTALMENLLPIMKEHDRLIKSNLTDEEAQTLNSLLQKMHG